MKNLIVSAAAVFMIAITIGTLLVILFGGYSHILAFVGFIIFLILQRLISLLLPAEKLKNRTIKDIPVFRRTHQKVKDEVLQLISEKRIKVSVEKQG